ncbi:Athe_2463 domain-containing protein [Paenibacillus sinopodophylli]|uniref:Athe_2463 domain-containing protein n=1 Tax=Paenibacillus sinopodophylli TaxID=1837342 RepID=UPI001486AA61|nr:CARDB domain-containing protein [Paenibacillus sinopodophylli]
MKLNGNYLSNACGIGKNLVVYGTPEDVTGNEYDQSQWRYLGYDINGTVYRNWLFRSDSRATLHVAKNWVKSPWSDTTIKNKGVQSTVELTSHPDAKKWLEAIVDPYNEFPTFIQSYNKRTNNGWTGDTLKDYVVIQQIPTKFTPGVIQMWNIWQPDGSYWYEMFYIPPLDPLEVKELPDLVITDIKTDPVEAAASSWVGDNITVKITSKNEGNVNSGSFTVGIVGTNIKSEVISNIPPGQIKTVSVKVSSASAGIIKYTAMTDFGKAVTESNESNNTMPFQIVYSKKNEPTSPIAIISHKDGDHRTEPEITIKPIDDPKLDDTLSYSPGKEAITVREWKYKTPSGTTIQKKPVANDFALEGKYLIELRVTNSANKVSEWAHLTINVGDKATPTPSTEPTPKPRPELKASIRFQPNYIIAGEKSSLLNSSNEFESMEWSFSPNLDPIFPDKTQYDYHDQTFTASGTYRANITVRDSSGSATDDATLTVIDPRPVAIVAGASKVIEGRPFPFPYHLNNSYTPLADRGATIDHSRSEKKYSKVGVAGSSTGFPTVNNLALGEYLLEGKVYDTTGRVSDWAELLMEVVPDLPPTVEVIAPEEAYRSSGFMLFIEAESPDADQIVHLLLEERYDDNNDGNFEDEPWTRLYDGSYKTTHSLNYTTVGKRQYRATVTEDYGKSGVSERVTTDILNYTPAVNFNVFGITQQPGQGENSGPPVTNYTTQSIFRSWVAKRPYAGGDMGKVVWKTDSSSISTKIGEMVSFNVKYPNAGMGLNSRNKYSLATDLVAKPMWEVQKFANGYYDISTSLTAELIFNNNRLYTSYRSNESHEQIDEACNCRNQKYYFTETDAVTGEALSPQFSFPLANYLTMLKEDENFYNFNIINQSSVRIIRVMNHGQTIETHTFNISGIESGATITARTLELTPDFKSAILAVEHSKSSGVRTDYYKYNFELRSVVWLATGSEYGNWGGQSSYPKTVFAPNGTIFIAGNILTKILPNGTRIDSAPVKGFTNAISTFSGVTQSDDGQYLYLNSYYSVNGSPYKMMFTTYNANDLSIVSDYKFTDDYPPYSPVVRPDGNVMITTGVEYYLFSKTGGLLLSSRMYTDGMSRLTQPGLLSNGDFFGFQWIRTLNRDLYGLYNVSKDMTMISEKVEDKPVNFNNENPFFKVTPILPNGSVFFFGPRPNSITPMVSASGNTSPQDIDANTVGIFNDNWGGLLYDAGSVMKNYALEFNVSVNDIKNDKVIGAGFHIQNEKNLYTVEWSKSDLTLYKSVNGVKTTLQTIALTRSPYTTYPFKVEAINGTLTVSVNYEKKLEVTDGTYTKGAAGIMSLGQSSASFSQVKKTNYGDTYTQETYDSVLVNDPISYEKLFNDIENDKVAAEEWSYSQNPNFFENPEGTSIHHGQSYAATINTLEKPGVYEITFRAQDNPGLPGYRKWSEPVKKLLYVHRRPVAQPDVRFTGKVFTEGEALDYETFDKSYDPDISHILSDKVFRTRWADQTTWITGKREYYNRPGVELIIQEQVRDIHGAWSYWGQTVVYKDAIPPVNQTKPVMTITVPAGTTAATPTVLIKEPTIRWTYFDAENDPQEQYRLTLTYVDTNETALYIEHEGNARSYSIVEETIEPGRVVKVQGQVSSAGVWSNISNSRYFVLDLPPQTYLLSFNGQDANQPIYTRSSRPLLQVFTVDPENHPIQTIDYEVFHAGSGARVVDTELAIAAASYTPPALAEGLHYWRARSNDSYLWGPYSSNGFFFVDTVKPADVNEQLEIEPTAVTVSFQAFKDAEPSSGHASRMFYLQKVNAGGSVTSIDLNGDGQVEYSLPLTLERTKYRVAGLEAGQEYRLTVIDYDIAGNEGVFAYIHFVTNRPPIGNFDWKPKPVYEGDLTTFMSLASDPDSDTLSILYELTSPSGKKSSYSYSSAGPDYQGIGPALKLDIAGTWRMTMTVSDGIAEPIAVSKTVQVLPLHVKGFVTHTELWEQHRKAYNLKASGSENAPRGLSVFWAGEKFIIEADTTLTGTATKADKVVVKLDKYEAVLTPINAVTRDRWKGELWNEQFSKLPNGNLRFQFTAYYNNDIMKSDWVEVAIQGQSLQIIGVHRVQ